MKISYWLVATVCLLLLNNRLHAQSAPPPPQIKVVSIDPATNDVTIKWSNTITLAFPLDYHTPYILEYPRTMPTPINCQIGTIIPMPDSMVVIPHATTAPCIGGGNSVGTIVDIAPQGFCLTAKSTLPGTQESALTDYHFPSFLTVGVDTCSAQAVLTWTPYKTTDADLREVSTWNKPFNDSIEYEVWGYQGNPPFNTSLATKLSDRIKDTIFYSQTMDKGKNYYFFVKAYLPKGHYLLHSDEVSTTNRVNATYMGVAIPKYINIPRIEVKDNSIELDFQIDPGSELFDYTIERTTDPASGFTPIYDFIDKTLTTYTDTDVNTEEKYYYRISATRCDSYVQRSDIVNTIIPTSEYTSDTKSATLNWSSFVKPGSTYTVIRVIPDNATVAIGLADSSYVDNVLSLIQQGYDRFCYYVVGTAPNGDVSISNKTCFIVEPDVYMPDAIDPTKVIMNATTGAQRNRFGPIVDMNSTMYGYDLLIFNRWGVKVFEAKKKVGEPLAANHLWDGKLKGKIVEPGLYLYTITVYFPNSKTSQKGDVSVFY